MSTSATEDVVWMDVLPSMGKFFPALAKGTDQAAEKAGKSAGAKFGKAFGIGVAAMGAGAIAVGKQLYNLGATFDEVTDTIRVGTGAQGKELDALVKIAKSVGKQVPANFEQIGVAVADLNTTLGYTGKPLEDMSKQVLQLGRMTGAPVNIRDLSSAIAGFNIPADKATKTMDELYQVSQATGVPVNELTANLKTQGGILRQVGLGFTESAALIGTLQKAGVNANTVVKGMGPALVRLSKDGEKPAQAFQRVTKQLTVLTKQGKDGEALQLASKVFGTRGATQFVAALKSGKINLDDMRKAAGLSGDTILGAAEETNDFAEQWMLFGNQMKVLIAPAAEKVFSLITTGMEWINANAIPALEGFGKGWNRGTGIGGKAHTVFDRVFTVIRRGSDWINRVAIPALEGFGKGWNRGTGISGKAHDAYDKLFSLLRAGMGWINTVAVPAIKGFAQGWRDGTGAGGGFRDIVQKVVDAVRASIEFVIRYKGEFAALGAAILTVITFIKTYQAVMWVAATVMKVVTAVTGAYAAAQRVLNLVLAANPIGLVIAGLILLGAGLVLAYQKSETFRRIVNGTWNAIKETANTVWTFLRDRVLTPLGTFFGTTLPEKMAAFKSAFKTVWEATKAAAATPINFVISTVYNNGLRKAMNLIPGVNLAEASTIAGYRTGGYTGNIDPNHVAGVVHGREYVLTDQETSAMGGPGGVRSWLNTALGRGYKGGGYVWPTNSRALSGNYPGHSGIDVAVPTGSPLFAVNSGQIGYVGSGRGYGNAIFLNDSSGVPWVYGHGSRALVSAGQAVSKGQLIGYSGYSGNVRPAGPAGAHLHIEAAMRGFAAAANRGYTFGLLNGSGIPAGGGAPGAPGGGSVFDLLTEFPKLFTGIKTKLDELSKSPWGRVLKSGVAGIVDSAENWGLGKIKGVGDAIWSGAKNAWNFVTQPFGGYALGTLAAAPGPAFVGERGPELVIGKQARMMRGGERVLSSSETRGLFGGDSGRLRIIDGTFRIDEDSTVWVRGIAEDVVDDRAEGTMRRARV